MHAADPPGHGHHGHDWAAAPPRKPGPGSAAPGEALGGEVRALLRWARTTETEARSAGVALESVRRAVDLVPGLCLPLLRTGSRAGRAALAVPGAAVDAEVGARARFEHCAVLLSLLAARLREDGEWGEIGLDACCRVPWLWARHAATGTAVHLRVRVLVPGRIWPETLVCRADRAVSRLVLDRPEGVRAAVVLLKALAVAVSGAESAPPVSGLGLALLAGSVLAQVPADDLAAATERATLLLWGWFARLPATGAVLVIPDAAPPMVRRVDGVCPLVVRIADPDDMRTDCAAGTRSRPQWWASVSATCRAGLAALADRGRGPTGDGAVPLLPGTLLHPAQWLVWQLVAARA